MKDTTNWHLITKILSGEANSEDKIEFESWLNQSESNRELFNELAGNWEQSRLFLHQYSPDVEKAWYRLKSEIKSKADRNKNHKTWRIDRSFIRIAASIAIIFGLITSMYFGARYVGIVGTEILVYTSGDTSMVLELPDHSLVTLNRYSTLEVPEKFRGKNRKVQLTGEGYFDIRKDENHPFIVATGQTITKVLGTTFNIREDKSSQTIEILLNTGRVEFWSKLDKKQRLYLQPGDMVTYSSNQNTLQKTVPNDPNILAWKTGEIIFKDTPLQEALRIIEKQYDVKFRTNSDLKEYSLTARFTNVPVEELIDIIQFTLDIQIHTDDQKVYIIEIE